MEFKRFKRKGLSEMITIAEFKANGGDMTGVSVSQPDQELAVNNPQEFDKGYIARNPENHEDLWYVAKDYFDKNLEPAEKEETFMDRLIRERDELNDKGLKLMSFLSKEDAEQIVGEYQHRKLKKQLRIMTDYVAVLNDRIGHLSTPNK